MKRLFYMSAISFAVLTGCADENGFNGLIFKPGSYVYVESIAFNDSVLTLTESGTPQKLLVTVTPKNEVAPQEYVWKTTDSTVASVNALGFVTPKKTGTAKIIAVCTDKMSKKDFADTCIVTVVPPVYIPALALIAGGAFTMGDQHGLGNADELPLHPVTVSSFKMSKTEITQREYLSMMAVNPSKFTGDLLPVENVTWYDAVLFCNALSKHEGRDTVYSYTGTPIVGSNGETAELTGISADMAKNGYRLPTEAEWEFAAQGKRNTKYATDDGTISTSKGNYNATEANPPTGSTVSVGQYPANLYGLFDMAGNLWEWCHDYYGGYSVDAQIDPLGGTIGTHRVLRGGSWYNHASYTRTAGRNKGKPYIRDYDVGFRIVSRDY